MIKKTSISLKPFSLNLQFQRSLQPLLWWHKRTKKKQKQKKTPLYMFPIPLSDWLHQWNLLSHSCHNKMAIMVTVHLFWTGITEKAISFKRQNREPRILSVANSHDKQEMTMTSWLNYTRSSQSMMSIPNPGLELNETLTVSGWILQTQTRTLTKHTITAARCFTPFFSACHTLLKRNINIFC